MLLTLTWGAVTGAVTYRGQVATDSLFASMMDDDSLLTTASWTIGTFANNVKLYWRVNAKNSAGTSSWSTIFNFTTILAVPVAPVLQTPANGAINQPVSLILTWGDANGAITYRGTSSNG